VAIDRGHFPRTRGLQENVYLRTLLSLPVRFWVLSISATALMLALRFGLDTVGKFQNDVGGVSAYITAIGTLYGILAAFTIYVVWTQFNQAKDAVDAELNELLDLFRFAVYLRDPQPLSTLRAAIEAYGRTVVTDEWPSMTKARLAPITIQLGAIFYAVHSVQFDDERDSYAWAEMMRKFEAISDARGKRLQLATERVPILLRALLYMASVALVLGFFMLAVNNDFLVIAMTIATTAIVFLTVEVVEDLDSPFGGQWFMTSDGFKDLPASLTEIEPAAKQAKVV
jgi:nitrogen fixation-related uncharacterized protein